MYVFYDRVSKLFGEQLFYAYNEDEAKRSFVKTVTRDGVTSKDDIELYYVGEYDRVGIVTGKQL